MPELQLFGVHKHYSAGTVSNVEIGGGGGIISDSILGGHH